MPHLVAAAQSRLEERWPSTETAAEGGAADVFGAGGGKTAEPVVDVKALHAKIGELTLENDFLEGALSKAGLLSAKR
jgi:hypothetical protein